MGGRKLRRNAEDVSVACCFGGEAGGEEEQQARAHRKPTTFYLDHCGQF
jgi:hypothetical protein